jgi:cell division protein ZapE
VDDLVHVHPSRFGAYVDGIVTLGLIGVAPLRDQNEALRVVSLVDRLYDRNVRVAASGVPFSRIFGDEMLAGGYRKKYQRALSRLGSMAGGES